jgi:hypothetical protein
MYYYFIIVYYYFNQKIKIFTIISICILYTSLSKNINICKIYNYTFYNYKNIFRLLYFYNIKIMEL